MEIRKGYKQTEVGVICDNWEVKSISEFSTCVRGGSPRPAGSPRYFNGDFIPWLTVAALTNISPSQLYVWETDTCLTEEGSHHSRTLEKETLIIANSGATLGVAKLLSIKCCANDGIAILLDFNKNIDKLYTIYFINSITKRLREVVATGNGQPNLNTDLIGAIRIPLPPTKSEQTAISTALSDADALITSLEKLIEKKRAIKQGAMQKLLRPKVGWEEKPINEIISLMTNGFVGIVKSHYSESDSGILYIQGYNVEENSFNFNGIKRVTHEFHNQHSKSCLQEGDLLTIQTGDIGITTIVPKELEGANCHALVITRFKKNKVDSRFYSYYFNSFEGKRRLKEIETGSTMKHLNVGDMIQMLMPYPSRSEQTRIATILSDMDAEITVLAQKLGKYKLIKQGMMQKLLTGRIRLI